MLFGSVVLGRQRADSDLDIAVAAKQALTAHEKIALVRALTDYTGRSIDLIDLKMVSIIGYQLKSGHERGLTVRPYILKGKQ
jgi:predicted nucleotidyltransferase